jgi:hypothetical protein
MTLTGPNPYDIRGTAELEICGIGVDADFHAVFGDRRPEAVPPASDPLGLLVAEIARAENWRPLSPAHSAVLRVAVTEAPADPLDRLRFVQKALPLGLHIDRVGRSSAGPAGIYLDIRPSAGSASDLLESFAPGEYLELTDEQRIALPPFRPHKAGLAFAWSEDELDEGALETWVMTYETRYPAGLARRTTTKTVVRSPRFVEHGARLGRRYHHRAPLTSQRPTVAPPCTVDDHG